MERTTPHCEIIRTAYDAMHRQREIDRERSDAKAAIILIVLFVAAIIGSAVVLGSWAASNIG